MGREGLRTRTLRSLWKDSLRGRRVLELTGRGLAARARALAASGGLRTTLPHLARASRLLVQRMPCGEFTTPDDCRVLFPRCDWNDGFMRCIPRTSGVISQELLPSWKLKDVWRSQPWLKLFDTFLNLRAWAGELGVPEGVVAPYSLKCLYVRRNGLPRWTVHLVPERVECCILQDYSSRQRVSTKLLTEYQFVVATVILHLSDVDASYLCSDETHPENHQVACFFCRDHPNAEWDAYWSDPNYPEDYVWGGDNHFAVASSLLLAFQGEHHDFAFLRPLCLFNVNACLPTRVGFCAQGACLSLMAALDWRAPDQDQNALSNGKRLMRHVRQSCERARGEAATWVPRAFRRR